MSGSADTTFHRADPFSLPRQERRDGFKTFTDPNSGHKVSVHLHSIDGVEVTMALEEADRYATAFCDDPENPDTENPKFFLMRGEPVRLSKRVIQNICLLLYMQHDIPKDHQYDFETWVGIAKRMDRVWAEILLWGMTFAPQLDKPLGNSLTGLTAGSSISSPNGTSDTPSSSSDRTSSLGEPTSSFERSALAPDASPEEPRTSIWSPVREEDKFPDKPVEF